MQCIRQMKLTREEIYPLLVRLLVVSKSHSLLGYRMKTGFNFLQGFIKISDMYIPEANRAEEVSCFSALFLT